MDPHLAGNIGGELLEAVRNVPGKSSKASRASRRSKLMSLYSMNTSGKLAAMDALKKLRCKSRTIAAIAFQELHCLPAAIPDLQVQADANGWNVSAVPGVKDAAASAGVAISTPKHVPRASTSVVPQDCSPGRSPGRLAALWVQAAIPGGLLVLSVYLWHTEGASSRNVEIILRALSIARNHGGPWAMLGDFNCSLGELASAMGAALQAAGAVIISTREPTHYPGGTAEPATLDFGLVDARIANGRVVRSIEVDLDLAIGKHRAVCVKVSNKGHICYVTRFLRPRAFPRNIPVGCARKPVVASGDLEEVGLDRFYERTLACAEAEAARLHDLVESDGKIQSQFAGRELGLRTRQGLLLPPRSRSCLGIAREKAYVAKWIDERLRELRHHSDLHRKGLLTLAGLKQVEGIRRRFKRLAMDEKRMSVLVQSDARWASWVEQVVNWDFDNDEQSLEPAQQTAKALQQQLAQEHLQASQTRWKQWIKDKLPNGGAAVHAYVKREVQRPILLQGDLRALDASPQAVLDGEEARWREVWHRLEGKYGQPWQEAELPPSQKLPPITAKQIWKAALSFSPRTGVGEDVFHPRLVAFLSEEVRSCYAQVLNTAEDTGCWPSIVSVNLIHLIPKLSGGMRPIGLMATLIRIYERVRRNLVARWREENCEDFNYMANGRSSIDAVWNQSVRDEAAARKGILSASALLDLIKAFESVRLDIIWATGVENKFPLPVLRLALQAYCLTRRLVFREAVGKPIRTFNAILAGGGFATDLLALLLHKTLLKLKTVVPDIHLYVVVDDLTIRAEGTASNVSTALAKAVRLCIHDLEETLDMQVSRGKAWETPDGIKSVALASTPEARRSIRTSMRALGIPTRLTTKNLGVDYAQGRRARQRVTMLGRWRKVKTKAKKCVRLGREAALHVSRTALVPSLVYGVECTSLPSGVLQGLRGVVAEMAGPINGRSTTARLAMRSCEPAYSVILAPLRAWWKALWRNSLPRSTMEAAFHGAADAAQQAGHLVHSNVAGGAGAYLSSLKRIGWQAQDISSIITEKGCSMRLGVNCDPKMLLRLASTALERKLAIESGLSAQLSSLQVADGYHRASSQASGFVPMGKLPGLEQQAMAEWWAQFQHDQGRLIPWLRPAVDALRTAKRRGVEECATASFISLIEGGWWTQSRLHHNSLAADPLCKCCGKEHGTLWHRVARLCGANQTDSPASAIVDVGAARW